MKIVCANPDKLSRPCFSVLAVPLFGLYFGRWLLWRQLGGELLFSLFRLALATFPGGVFAEKGPTPLMGQLEWEPKFAKWVSPGQAERGFVFIFLPATAGLVFAARIGANSFEWNQFSWLARWRDGCKRCARQTHSRTHKRTKNPLPFVDNPS